MIEKKLTSIKIQMSEKDIETIHLEKGLNVSIPQNKFIFKDDKHKSKNSEFKNSRKYILNEIKKKLIESAKNSTGKF